MTISRRANLIALREAEVNESIMMMHYGNSQKQHKTKSPSQKMLTKFLMEIAY